MSESEDQKTVLKNDLRNSQFGGGLINAENVNAERIGSDIFNIENVFALTKDNNLAHTVIKEIPYIGVKHFVGRSQELAFLHETLYQRNAVAISAVAGMGGVGKTELAVKYAQHHEKDYPGGICWFNVRESNIAGSIIAFAQNYLELEVPQQDFSERQLAPIEQVKWCWEHWRPASGLVLVVLDDVTNLEDFAEYLPKNSRFRVLITTRLRNIDANIEEISLDVLSPGEALSLLQAIIGERRVKRELATAEKLCSWLGYLPLGIELVGRYLQEDPDLSLAEILERLEDTRISDEALLIQQPNLSTAQRGVKAAFELSWKELNVKTQYIAQFISLLAPAPFAWEWLDKIDEHSAQKLGWDKQDLRSAKKRLYKLHIIQRLEELDGCYKTHPLICEFLQDKLNLEIEATQIKSAFVQPFIEIARKIPNTPTREFIFSISLYIPHLEEVAKNLSNVVTDEDFWSVFTGIARFYNGQGLYAIAEPWYKWCLEEVKVRLGAEHPDYATSLNNLAYLYQLQGRYNEAEPLFKQALELYKQTLGEEHSHFATSLSCLAYLYKLQGRYNEAEPLFQQALELYKQTLGEEHSDFASSLNNLANLYYSQERYGDAEPLFKKALELKKRVLEEKHPDFAGILNNLGLI